ncbi:MAG: hypothetical protein JJU05_07445 [Verrucomicrobia bacterium]|nr:hypothetical protein [Verrucomicrobiota bacterium]MCH8527760.1 hypothetical protein [Kiritimatiellia bacterium]
MKRFFLILSGLALCTGLFADGLPVEVRMLNGDVFPGHFRTFDAGYFQVMPEWGGDPLRFHAAYTGRLRFMSGQPIERRTPDTRVRFVNGDRISGRLVELTDRELILDAWWGSRLRANREFVSYLDVLPGEGDLIFRGLSPLSEWSVRMPSGSDGVIEENAVEWLLPENARIARPLPLPDAGGVLFEMEISFPDGVTHANLELFHASARNRPTEGLSLSLNPNWLHVRTLDGNGRQTWVLREPLPPEAAWQRMLISVHLNVETAEATLRINEYESPSFTLHTERPLAGREDLEVAVQAGRDTAGLLLHAVEFSKRSGVYQPEVEIDGASRDVVVFGNGDQMEALLLSMDSEGATLQLEGGQEVRVPRGRIQTARLATRPSIHPRRRDRDVQLHLAERGDRLTLAMASFNYEGISGSSDLWRHIPNIPSGAVRELRLNIYQGVRHDDSYAQPPLFLFER